MGIDYNAFNRILRAAAEGKITLEEVPLTTIPSPGGSGGGGGGGYQPATKTYRVRIEK